MVRLHRRLNGHEFEQTSGDSEGQGSVLLFMGSHSQIGLSKVKVKSLSHVRPSVAPWTAAFQAPPPMGFSRQDYWSGVPLPSPVLLEITSQMQPLLLISSPQVLLLWKLNVQTTEKSAISSEMKSLNPGTEQLTESQKRTQVLTKTV